MPGLTREQKILRKLDEHGGTANLSDLATEFNASPRELRGRLRGVHGIEIEATKPRRVWSVKKGKRPMSKPDPRVVAWETLVEMGGEADSYELRERLEEVLDPWDLSYALRSLKKQGIVGMELKPARVVVRKKG